MVSWGIVMTCQGLVQNHNHLYVTRILLGLTESGFFPAASYLLTTWYCRFEVQTRLAVFFSAASLAGAFSGLLAFGIEKMEGVGGLAGWRWIFILEGIVTVAVGATLYWTLPDSPATCSFLTQQEKSIIDRRLMQDAGTKAGHVSTDDGFQWRFLKEALLEWKIWFAVIIYWGNSVSIDWNRLNSGADHQYHRSVSTASPTRPPQSSKNSATKPGKPNSSQFPSTFSAHSRPSSSAGSPTKSRLDGHSSSDPTQSEHAASSLSSQFHIQDIPALHTPSYSASRLESTHHSSRSYLGSGTISHRRGRERWGWHC